jgi:hypothetical protein
MRDGRLVRAPALGDLALAALRRVAVYLPPELHASARAAQAPALDTAKGRPAAPWQGHRLDLVRYSGRQRRTVELRGITGHLDLPQGPGALWPLLAAAQWLHLGKGTVHGLGRLTIARLP